MSSNAIAAVAVVLVSGFAGCAATAKAEPVAISAPVIEAAPAPLKATMKTTTSTHAITIAVGGKVLTLHC